MHYRSKREKSCPKRMAFLFSPQGMKESRKRPDLCQRIEIHIEACQLVFLMIYAYDPTNP
jgi:hypothetical protein